MHRPVLVLIHASWETPALIDVALHNIPSLRRSVLNERTPELPPVSSLGGLVVMGGPQDANDDVQHPGLVAERRLLAEAVNAEVPVLGVCLGMQLLALSLGAKLHLRHGKEIGFAPVTFTEQGLKDPVLAPFAQGKGSTFLHWHSDAVELPQGAEVLASTAITPVQAFRIGSALGTQFHPEADSALLDAWLGTKEMTDGLAPERVEAIRQQGSAHLPTLRESVLSGFGAFADAVRKRRGL